MRDKFGESAVSLAAGLRGSFPERHAREPGEFAGEEKGSPS